MENEQTAIEWIEDELAKLNSAAATTNITQEEYHNQRVGLWEQAKLIEKRQREKIADKAREEGWKEGKYGYSRW